MLVWSKYSLEALLVCIDHGYFAVSTVQMLRGILNSDLRKAINKSMRRSKSRDLQDVIKKLDIKKVMHAVAMVKKVSDGATGNVEGLSGSICPSGIVKIVAHVSDIHEKNFFDFGTGVGNALFSFLSFGVKTATGVELLANLEIVSPIFESAKRKLGIRKGANIGFMDICDMKQLPHNTNLTLAFWTGHPVDVRTHTMYLASSCISVSCFACSNAPGETHESVLSGLNKHACGSGNSQWTLSDSFTSKAVGGNMQCQIWIFGRTVSRYEYPPKDVNQHFPSDLAVSTFLSLCGDNRNRTRSDPKFDKEVLLKVGTALHSHSVYAGKLLSRGGFGQVVGACSNGKDIALKISLSKVGSSPIERQKCSIHREHEIILFANEKLRNNSRYTHPNIVQLEHCFRSGREEAAMLIVSLGTNSIASVLGMKLFHEDCRRVKDRLQLEVQNDGTISADGRLFFGTLATKLAMVHDVKLAHRDLKWANILLVKEWKKGTDPEFLLTDFGIGMIETTNREYVEQPAETSKTVSSSRAKKIAGRVVMQTKKPYEVVTKAALSKVMDSQGINSNFLCMLSSGSPGYRPPLEQKHSAQRKRKNEQPRASTLKDAQAHDIFSLGAMMA
jgi:hypothetical protein